MWCGVVAIDTRTPASLHLWVGDAATRDAEVVVALEAGAVGGEQDDDDENVVWRLPHEEL